MEEAVLTKTRRFFKKNNIMFKISLMLLVILGTVYAFLFANALLKIILLLALGVLVVSFFSNYISNFLLGKGYKLADALNEILYIFLGVPILLIAIGYLPLSIYILFFSKENNDWIIPLLIGIMVTVQIAAFIMIIRGRGKEKGRSFFGYFVYLFDFKRRAEEQRKFSEQTRQIDSFYSDMEKVKDRVDNKMEKSVITFQDYEWKRKKGIKKEEHKEIVCWNCKKLNAPDALVCIYCSAPLKKEQF